MGRKGPWDKAPGEGFLGAAVSGSSGGGGTAEKRVDGESSSADAGRVALGGTRGCGWGAGNRLLPGPGELVRREVPSTVFRAEEPGARSPERAAAQVLPSPRPGPAQPTPLSGIVPGGDDPGAPSALGPGGGRNRNVPVPEAARL